MNSKCLHLVHPYFTGLDSESDDCNFHGGDNGDVFGDNDSDEEFVPETPDSPSREYSSACNTCDGSTSSPVSRLEHEHDVNDTYVAETLVFDPYTCKRMHELDMNDMLGREFNTLNDAAYFLHNYANDVRFGLRKDDVMRNKGNMLTMRKWVCCRAGFRLKKYLERDSGERESRSQSRCGCLVSFHVNYQSSSGKWEFREFKTVHNHELVVPRERFMIWSNRYVPEGALTQARTLRSVGVKMSQIMDIFALQCAGLDKVGFTRKDLQNRLDDENRRIREQGDAEAALAFLLGKGANDPGFVCKLIVDDCDRLRNLFWCDSICKMDYDCFGDVILFDTTYRQNLYKKPLVVIVGLNHHWKTNVYAFALSADEIVETYNWILQTFFHAMSGKEPLCVITDGDKAMRKSIRKVLPNSEHRLCTWRLYRNAVSNLKDKHKAQAFRSCMFNPETEEEFNEQWESFICKYSLQSNGWVAKAYRKRYLWAEYNFKGKFYARMTINQRCESMNANLKFFLLRSLKLYEFVDQIDRALTRLRHDETQLDYVSKSNFPVYISHLREFEQQAAQLLTVSAFKYVRSEILNEQYMNDIHVEASVDHMIFKVARYQNSKNLWQVVYQYESTRISCSFLCYESVGLPCSHILTVLKFENFAQIPNYMLPTRWRKFAKSGCNIPSAQLDGRLHSSASLGAFTPSHKRFPSLHQNLFWPTMRQLLTCQD